MKLWKRKQKQEIKWFETEKAKELIKEQIEPNWENEIPSLIEYIQDHLKYIQNLDVEDNNKYTGLEFMKTHDSVVRHELEKNKDHTLLYLQLKQLNFNVLDELFERYYSLTEFEDIENCLFNICQSLAKDFHSFNLFILGEKDVLPKLYNPEDLSDKVKYNPKKKSHWFNNNDEIKKIIEEIKPKRPNQKQDFNEFMKNLLLDREVRDVNFNPYKKLYEVDYVARYYFGDDCVNFDYYQPLEHLFGEDFYDTYQMPYSGTEDIKEKEKILEKFVHRIIGILGRLHKKAIEKKNEVDFWFKEPKYKVNLDIQEKFKDNEIPDLLKYVTKIKEEINSNPNSIEPDKLHLKLDTVLRKAFENKMEESYVSDVRKVMARSISYHNHVLSSNKGDKPLLESYLADAVTQFVLRFNQMRNTALKKKK